MNPGLDPEYTAGEVAVLRNVSQECFHLQALMFRFPLNNRDPTIFKTILKRQGETTGNQLLQEGRIYGKDFSNNDK